MAPEISKHWPSHSLPPRQRQLLNTLSDRSRCYGLRSSPECAYSLPGNAQNLALESLTGNLLHLDLPTSRGTAAPEAANTENTQHTAQEHSSTGFTGFTGFCRAFTGFAPPIYWVHWVYWVLSSICWVCSSHLVGLLGPPTRPAHLLLAVSRPRALRALVSSKGTIKPSKPSKASSYERRNPVEHRQNPVNPVNPVAGRMAEPSKPSKASSYERRNPVESRQNHVNPVNPVAGMMIQKPHMIRLIQLIQLAGSPG